MFYFQTGNWCTANNKKRLLCWCRKMICTHLVLEGFFSYVHVRIPSWKIILLIIPTPHEHSASLSLHVFLADIGPPPPLLSQSETTQCALNKLLKLHHKKFSKGWTMFSQSNTVNCFLGLIRLIYCLRCIFLV